MNKWNKRIASAVLAAGLTFSLVGCGSGSAGTQTSNATD